ncbi:hypothetical protein COV93_02285 [Candidatus Woesearchaeota archaeon CG11_big_fil_rev_8_21_14_0_20_43_8]|nr:MAG: hypothetical protein COV93_02285 [Candidatus Woesearchaeota archaeon CG11_big_fil_rev_8_21_14_0_20_43_8]PIO05259.1 MAG: hypothetical protein COT47_05535 [Candidatus Woesearchaeota archaeon CG08_land_8_20_14_0_20_43_7]
MRRGVSFGDYGQRTRLEEEHLEALLKHFSHLSVDHVSLHFSLLNEDKDDPTACVATEKTMSDDHIKRCIDAFNRIAIDVQLKPHIDTIIFPWRGEIAYKTKKDLDDFFDRYYGLMHHYAVLSESHGAKEFCIGTELKALSKETERWKALIKEIRNDFSGQITYAANHDEYQSVRFFDSLDYIGIDFYSTICNEKSPSLDTMKKGLEKHKKRLKTFSERENQKIVFTEVGITSRDYACKDPWEWGDLSKYDANPWLQERYYEAIFQTFWNETWFDGMFFWDYPYLDMIDGSYEKHFCPYNKPAESVMMRWFS